jgi:catalase
MEIRDAAGEVQKAVEPKEEKGRSVAESPALSQMNTVKGSIKSRRVAMLLAPGYDGAQVKAAKLALDAQGAHTDVVSLGLGTVKASDGTLVPVDKTSQVAASVTYDAVFVPGGAHVETLVEMDEVSRFLAEAFKHGKAIGVVAEATALLPPEAVGAPGVISGNAGNPEAFVSDFTTAIGQHRFHEREGSRGGLGSSRSAEVNPSDKPVR